MDKTTGRQQIISQLKREILAAEGFKPSLEERQLLGISAIEDAFPNHVFPSGQVHELISYNRETATATNGFITALLSRLAAGRTCLWVSRSAGIYPPALQQFGVASERMLFAQVNCNKELLWVTEEALKCAAFSAVIADIRELSFTDSRRLQLAVENSRVTGFIHRYCPRTENTVACVTRWKIKPLPSPEDTVFPGLGYPLWLVKLEKVRNGIPGQWIVQYTKGGLTVTGPSVPFHTYAQLKTA